MQKEMVIIGAVMLVLSVFLPSVYAIGDLCLFGVPTLLTFGLDWLCCGSVSGLTFITGLIVLIVGLVMKEKK